MDVGKWLVDDIGIVARKRYSEEVFHLSWQSRSNLAGSIGDGDSLQRGEWFQISASAN